MGDIIENRRYSGRLVGRYANRIANGELTLDGTNYTLYKVYNSWNVVKICPLNIHLPIIFYIKNNGGDNNDLNSLHGGEFGFDQRVWSIKGGVWWGRIFCIYQKEYRRGTSGIRGKSNMPSNLVISEP